MFQIFTKNFLQIYKLPIQFYLVCLIFISTAFYVEFFFFFFALELQTKVSNKESPVGAKFPFLSPASGGNVHGTGNKLPKIREISHVYSLTFSLSLSVMRN